MFAARVKRVEEQLTTEKMDGVLISSISNIAYLTGYSNFFKEERDGYVLITKSGNYILTHSIYSKALKGKIPHFKVVEISRRETPEQAVNRILKNKNANLGIEEVDLRVYEYKKLLTIFKNLKNFNLHLKRSIKDRDEIKLIEKACEIGDEIYSRVIKKIKTGISEKQLVYEIDNEIKKIGLDNSFRTIVAFGKDSAYPHHESGNEKLKQNQFVLMDFGIKYKNYCSDMTRTLFFGEPDKRQRKMYEVVLESQKRAVEFIKDKIQKRKSVKVSDVDRVAREYIISQNFPSIPHSLGHGVGLEVHEHPHISPNSKEELKEGMVFSIEPGIYIEEFGGVRIEDLYVLEKDKIRSLTHSNSSLIEL